MNDKVDDWFSNLSEPQHLMLTELRELILDTDKQFAEELKWGQPCYSINRLVCYLQKAREHVTIGFQQGAHLNDTNQLLAGEGKDMRHVNFRLSVTIDRPAISDLISKAVEYDRR